MCDLTKTAHFETTLIVQFNKKYKKLLDADYWVSVQDKIKESGVMDYYPYGSEKRMCNIYKEK